MRKAVGGVANRRENCQMTLWRFVPFVPRAPRLWEPVLAFTPLTRRAAIVLARLCHTLVVARIRAEETLLQAHFGDEYEDYRGANLAFDSRSILANCVYSHDDSRFWC